jgi:branched-chain amino acid transport system ATP-binding protein
LPQVIAHIRQCVRVINQNEGTTVVIVEQNVLAILKQVELDVVIKSEQIIFDGLSQKLLE